jgi:hypothetical protein
MEVVEIPMMVEHRDLDRQEKLHRKANKIKRVTTLIDCPPAYISLPQ